MYVDPECASCESIWYETVSIVIIGVADAAMLFLFVYVESFVSIDIGQASSSRGSGGALLGHFGTTKEVDVYDGPDNEQTETKTCQG